MSDWRTKNDQDLTADDVAAMRAAAINAEGLVAAIKLPHTRFDHARDILIEMVNVRGDYMQTGPLAFMVERLAQTLGVELRPRWREDLEHHRSAELADRDAKLAAVLENPPTPPTLSIPRSANPSYWEGWEDAIDIFGQRFAALLSASTSSTTGAAAAAADE